MSTKKKKSEDLIKLKLSDEFLKMAAQNNFISLRDFTCYTIKKLMELPGMNYRMLVELNTQLTAQGLFDLLKEE